MANLLFTHVDIVLLDEADTILEDGYIAVTGERIESMGPMATLDRAAYPGHRKIASPGYGRRYVALPGYIQTHVHTTQALGRGLADDVDLITWTRKRIWPYEAALTGDDAYVSSLLSIAEMIKSGTTSFCEASGQRPDAIGKAIMDTGMQGIICLSTMDLPGEIPLSLRMDTEAAVQRNLELVARWHGRHPRVGVCLNILNLFLSSPKLWQTFTMLSEERDLLVQTHIAESTDELAFVQETTGMSCVRYLESLGALTPRLLAAHVVHVDEEEVELLARRGVKVMHLPAADLRIAGMAPIQAMLDKGIPVSLGVNSPPCNNRMSMMDEMWLAGLMHKAANGNPAAVPAKTVLRMATINGATALGRQDETGTLAQGKLADIQLLNLNQLCATPTHDLYSTIVYQATSETVDTVVARGEVLMEHRKLATIDEPWLVQQAQRSAAAIVQRAGIRL